MLKKSVNAVFDRKIDKSSTDCNNFLDTLNLPIISDEHKKHCDADISADDLKKSLFSMSNNKTPGNDGLTAEFYKYFWEDLKDILLESYKYSRTVGELSTSQRQAIIKLIEKKDKDKRFIENWRPISLLNIDTKILSKCIASRLIPVLPSVISSDQTAYVKGRYIGEGIRLISDVLETTKNLNLPGYMLTVDLEKAFDSIDHIFLLACLKKFGFGDNFLCWISVLLNKSESCVTNGGHTTKYFSLNRGARQGDPIAAYLFILVLEVFFIMLRSNDQVKKVCIMNFNFFLTAYADDTTFFVADINSVTIIFSTFDQFALFSGMKINKSKCELSGIGVKRSVPTALHGVNNVSLMDGSIRVLGVNFSYNHQIYLEKNFMDCVKKLRQVTQVWSMRFLTLYGKITIFKTLALSKTIYISCMSWIPNSFIDMIERIHNDFIWNKKRANIKHSTLIGAYSKGGLKDVDIRSKFKSLHLNWLTRLYDDTNFHPWKLIPLYYLNSAFANTIPFHPNLCVPDNVIEGIPDFYKNIILLWKSISQTPPTTASMILSECLWYNSHIKVDNHPIMPSFCENNSTIFLSDLFTHDGQFVTWDIASVKLNIKNRFKWIQIMSSIPAAWKEILKRNVNVDSVSMDIHLNVEGKIISINQLDSKGFYTLLIKSLYNPPTSQLYFDRLFGPNLNWEEIYLLPRSITKYSYLQFFQFKILHNILYLNSRLHHMNFSDVSTCSLCKNCDETPIHFFCECPITNRLWMSITNFFSPAITLDTLTPRSALLGFFTENDSDLVLKNLILLIFKYCIYKGRNDNPNQFIVISKIKSIYAIEKCIYSATSFEKKWGKVSHILE